RVGHVRAQAVLGGSPRHAQARVLPSGKYDQPGSASGAWLYAVRAAHQVGEHDGGSCPGHRHHAGMSQMEPLVAWFNDLPPHSVALAGGKGASLSDMTRVGLPVPSGFVVCAPAFQTFLAQYDGVNAIRRIADGLNVHHEGELNRAAVLLHDLI